MWEDFVQYPEPYGLGMEVDVALAVMEEKDDTKLLADVIGRHGRDRKSKAFKENQPDNISLKYGTSSAYLLGGLQRDRPDLAKKVTDKEVNPATGRKWTAHSAALEAGIDNPLNQIIELLPKISRSQKQEIRESLTSEVIEFEKVMKLLPKLSSEEKLELLKQIDEQVEEPARDTANDSELPSMSSDLNGSSDKGKNKKTMPEMIVILVNESDEPTPKDVLQAKLIEYGYKPGSVQSNISQYIKNLQARKQISVLEGGRITKFTPVEEKI